jgi:formylmethanofuran dehydrogenase subunit E
VSLNDHATVNKDGFQVPLIGIPKTAVREKCDSCGKEFGVNDVKLVENQMLCAKCAKEETR